MRLYLDEVGRYPLLTKDDEARLGPDGAVTLPPLAGALVVQRP